MLLPLALVLVAEGVLRLVGVGYATDFLVHPPRVEGVAARPGVEWVSNRRFGWRFFPRQLARAPIPLALGKDEEDGEDDGVSRIVVLGGSAAQGVPESAFGLARQLEAMLELRHPGQRFEVINAAMTAINSHVVLPIARDLARYDPDLFVVYMGNNEVVGPFGAGSVLGRFSPRLGWIRTTLALRASRLGQLGSELASALVSLGDGESPRTDRWRGMAMFLDQRLMADDPRLDAVVDHFERNLRDIVMTARGAGAAVVVSTVASNLRDQPPFAEPPTTSETGDDEPTALAEAVLLALGESRAGDQVLAELAIQVRRALERRPDSPRLHFALGRLELAAGRRDAAAEHLVRARDLDTLRFRADGRINQAIRRLAEAEGVALVDAETLFRDGGPGIEPLAGTRYFHEHVHFTFEGNHALAAALLPAIEAALGLAEASDQDPPSRDAVAEHLACSPFDVLAMERSMLALVERPPFVELPAHGADLDRRRRRVAVLEETVATGADAVWETTRALYSKRLEHSPDGVGQALDSRRRWAELLDQRGEVDAATEQWQRLTRTVPGVLAWHDALAIALARGGRPAEALDELERAEALAPEAAGEIANNRGELLAAAGRDDEARGEYERAAALRPFDPAPRYNLIALDLAGGDDSADLLAEMVTQYRDLLRDFPEFARGHHNLGVALSRLGRFDEAVTSLERAVEIEPSLASAYNSLGLAYEGLGRRQAAETAYRQALVVAPRQALAHFNLADLLLGSERPEEAIEHYRAGLALAPDNRVARRNLALALGMAKPEGG